MPCLSPINIVVASEAEVGSPNSINAFPVVVNKGRIIPCIIAGFQRLTQRSVKFIRWLRQNLWSQRPLPDLWAILKLLYRTS